MYLLGYLPTHNRVYVADKDMKIFSFALSLTLVEYQTAILREDYDTANELLPSISNDQRNKVARFLEAQDLKEMALQVATDPDQKFDLAIQLNDLDLALDLVREAPQVGSEPKWRTVGDKATDAWRIDLAEECYSKAQDLSALLLIYTSLGDKEGLARLADLAMSKGQHNIAFTCYQQMGDAEACLDLLIKTGRAPEAALFARTYAPSSAGKAVKNWKQTLVSKGKGKIADTLADPEVEEEKPLFESEDRETVSKDEQQPSANDASEAVAEVDTTEAPAEEIEVPEEDVKPSTETVDAPATSPPAASQTTSSKKSRSKQK